MLSAQYNMRIHFPAMARRGARLRKRENELWTIVQYDDILRATPFDFY
jgi:hypothetical protein